MAGRRGSGDDGNRGELAGTLGGVILEMVQQVVRQEVQELRTQMEQQLQERDEVIGALRRSLDARMQRAEERLAVMHERTASSETRMQNLEESLERALTTVVPKVDALLAQLEKQPPHLSHVSHSSTSNGTSTSASVPTSAPDSSPTTSQLPAASAHGAATSQVKMTDEEYERQRVELQILEVRARMDRARAVPSPLGEELCNMAKEGRVADVRRLLDSEVDVNYTNCNGGTALTTAFLARGRQTAALEVVALLLERGADVNAVDADGWSALHWAAYTDSSGRVVELLLRAGARANARDQLGTTPLHWAACKSNEAAVRTLLAAGAKRNLRGWAEAWVGTAPFDAARREDIRNLLLP